MQSLRVWIIVVDHQKSHFTEKFVVDDRVKNDEEKEKEIQTERKSEREAIKKGQINVRQIILSNRSEWVSERRKKNNVLKVKRVQDGKNPVYCRVVYGLRYTIHAVVYVRQIDYFTNRPLNKRTKTIFSVFHWF